MPTVDSHSAGLHRQAVPELSAIELRCLALAAEGKTPGHIVEAAIKALRDGHHGYTPAQGILPLREAVARDLERRHGTYETAGWALTGETDRGELLYELRRSSSRS